MGKPNIVCPCRHHKQTEIGQSITYTFTPNAVPVSAKSGLGMERLTAAVSDLLSREFLDLTIEIPVSNGRVAALLARDGEVLSKQYGDETVSIHCRLPKHVLGKLRRESDVVIHGLPEDAAADWNR